TFGLVISFAPAIGPSLSGWIVEHFPWQALFIMMLPIAVIDLIIAYFILTNVTERTNPRLDVLSIILSSFAFGGLLFGFGSAGNTGWVSYGVLIPLSIGVVSLGLFIWRQLILEEPMLELRVLKYPMFTLNTLLGMAVFVAMIGGMIILPRFMQYMVGVTACVYVRMCVMRVLKNPMFTLNTLLGMAVFVAMIGGMIILPLFMQNMAGFTATDSGLMLLPGAVIMGIMSPVTGRIFDRFGARWLAI